MNKLHHNKISSGSRVEIRGNRNRRLEEIAEMDNIKVVSDSKVDTTWCTPFQSVLPVELTADRNSGIHVNLVEHHLASPAHSYVVDVPLVEHVSHITTPEPLESSDERFSTSKDNIKDVHISARLMEEFMELAGDNTKNDLETCGILGAFLKNETFYVTTLIIPKQESSSNSCQALNEEEIHAILDGQSLFPVGWIHTHPSQTCFLSSIDLHTQYSFQVMLPEAIAIVMAPTDPKRRFGMFRLTEPGGMRVMKECNESGHQSGSGGFHLHEETSADGTRIYYSCSNVYINPNLRFEIFDLRHFPSSSS